jgi:hypothetical protein
MEDSDHQAENNTAPQEEDDMAYNNEGGDIINNNLDELQNEILNLEETAADELGDENEEPNQYDDESPIVDF